MFNKQRRVLIWLWVAGLHFPGGHMLGMKISKSALHFALPQKEASVAHDRYGRPRSATGLLLAACILALLLPALASGQEVTGSIIGTVTDPQGAVLKDATVTAKNVDRGTSTTTTTNGDGAFTLTRLPIGRYEVSVSAQGFEKVVRPAFALVLNQTAKVDFQMKVGATTETVEVRAEAPLLETATTDMSTHIDSVVTENVPLITRNYGQLTLLAPGAVSTNPGAFVSGQSTFQIGRPYINGNREQVNNYILDGMDNNQHDNNEVAYAPNVDAIQEFNLITQNPSAEFGNFMGGVVNATIKSGTNQYHGSGFEFFKNYALNANDWSNNLAGLDAQGHELVPRPQLRYNQFGATFGGPIIRDKLFFFVDYQGQRQSIPSSQTAVVLSAAERSGNFGELLAQGIQLFKPQAGVAPGSRTPIPGNNLTAAGLTLSPAALAVVNSSLYPLPNAPNNQFIFKQIVKNNLNQGDLKLDWRPTQKDQFFVRYSQQDAENPTTAAYVLNQNGLSNNSYPLQNGVADWTRALNSTTLNDLRFGVGHFPVTQSFANPTGKNLPQVFGIQGAPTGFLPSLFSAGGGPGFGGVSNIANNLGQSNVFADTVIQASDVVSKTMGTHDLRTGFQVNRYRDNFLFPGIEGLAGQLGFSGQYTSTIVGGKQTGGSGLADLMLGLPSTVGLGAGTGNRHVNNTLYGAFVQDNWRFRKNLTFNLGLRWDLATARVAADGNAVNFAIFGGQLITPTVNNSGLGAALYHTYNGIANFEPRIGIAWQPSFIPNTVVHVAYGISNFTESNGVNNLLTQNAPFEIAHSVTFDATSPLPNTTLDQGFTGFPAAGCTLAAAIAEDAVCFKGTTIHAFDPNLRPEVHYQWNLSVEHQFGNATTLEVGYVGQENQHLSNIIMMQQKILNANGTVSPSPFLNPTLLGFGGQDRLTLSNGVSNYNALQMVFVHRFTHGLQAQANYTWSKCLSDTPGFFGQFGDNVVTQAQTIGGWAFPQNPYNQMGDYGRCPQDVASLFNGYVVYQLPFGHGRSFANNFGKVADAVVGGWTISSSFAAHTGFAQTIFAPDLSGTGGFSTRANCVAGVPQHLPFQPVSATHFAFLNPAAVTAPGVGTFGTCPTGAFRGPGFKTLDLSLAKSISVTERQSLELRVDAVNFTNSPIFNFGEEFSGQHTVGASNFGQIDSSQAARSVQLGVKYRF